MGNYLNSGFNENLIRGYTDMEEDTTDIENSGIVEELKAEDKLPIKMITNSLSNGLILNEDNNLIKEVINDKLNTQSKKILGEFTFSASGAIAVKTDDDNGLWISPVGILAKKAGVTTFAIDSGGNATFAGTLSAATGTFAGTLSAVDGTFGTITAGTMTGVTIQTAATGLRTVLNNDNVKFYHDTTLKGLLRPDSTKSMLLGTASSFFIGDLSGNYNVEITAGGSIHILKNGQNIRFSNNIQLADYGTGGLEISGGLYPSSNKSMWLGASDRQWNFRGYEIIVDSDITSGGDLSCGGKISNDGDIQCGGKFKSSDGSGGVTDTGFTIVTWVTSTKLYTHDFDFKDGLVTHISGEHEYSF